MQSPSSTPAEHECRAWLKHGHPVVWNNPPPGKVHQVAGVASVVRQAVNDLAAKQADWPLVLVGGVGSGKTCAGLCIIKRFGGWYADLAHLHDMVIRARAGKLVVPGGIYEVFFGELWRDWHNANLTVLDELGQREPTAAMYDTVKRAIDERHGKPAVFISNLRLPELERVYDDRIVSRLAEGTVVDCGDYDRRLKKGEA